MHCKSHRECDGQFCVHLTLIPDDGVGRYLTKHSFWMFLLGCFQMKLAVNLMDKLKWFALPKWVGTIRFVEGLGRTKRRRKKESGLSA